MATTATGSPAPGSTVVVARDVEIERGHRLALSVDRFDLRAGEVVALVGPNGSGKSTLLHAIAGLVAHRGHLEVLGRAPGLDPSAVAYVLQSQAIPAHLPVTVDEVVGLARPVAFGRRQSAADRLAVATALERLEIADLRRLRVNELSGGQRQRVLVAQGLAQDAPILLLDEPVAGLDLTSIQRIADVVAEERAAGRAVVVATHDLGEASAADRVALLAGRMVAFGRPDEALTTASLHEAYGDRLVRLGDHGIVLDDAGHHGGGPDGHDHGQAG